LSKNLVVPLPIQMGSALVCGAFLFYLALGLTRTSKIWIVMPELSRQMTSAGWFVVFFAICPSIFSLPSWWAPADPIEGAPSYFYYQFFNGMWP